jgi:hypothetical protein
MTLEGILEVRKQLVSARGKLQISWNNDAVDASTWTQAQIEMMGKTLDLATLTVNKITALAMSLGAEPLGG